MALDICMASDDNFAIHLGISIISIMENKDFEGLLSKEEKEKYIGNYIIINKEFLTNRKGN